jgi:hypothetical protein
VTLQSNTVPSQEIDRHLLGGGASSPTKPGACPLAAR